MYPGLEYTRIEVSYLFPSLEYTRIQVSYLFPGLEYTRIQVSYLFPSLEYDSYKRVQICILDLNLSKISIYPS